MNLFFLINNKIKTKYKYVCMFVCCIQAWLIWYLRTFNIKYFLNFYQIYILPQYLDFYWKINCGYFAQHWRWMVDITLHLMKDHRRPTGAGWSSSVEVGVSVGVTFLQQVAVMRHWGRQPPSNPREEGRRHRPLAHAACTVLIHSSDRQGRHGRRLEVRVTLSSCPVAGLKHRFPFIRQT